MAEDQTLAQYLADRPWPQLRRLQRALKCRCEGDLRRCQDLRASILAYAARDGLTREQARRLAENLPEDPHTNGGLGPPEETTMDETPPQALTRAVDALAARLGRRLDLVPAARPHWWSVLGYTAAGEARLLLAAQEEGPLYTAVQRIMEN